MKITVSRDTIGRLLGVLVVTAIALLLSYLATAWIWWDVNPGHWNAAARGTQLALAVSLLVVRWAAGAVTIAEADEE